MELLARFEALTAMNMKIAVVWNVTRCAVVGSCNVSEEIAASVFIFIKQFPPSSCQFNEK
jgi:hypothetical protein